MLPSLLVSSKTVKSKLLFMRLRFSLWLRSTFPEKDLALAVVHSHSMSVCQGNRHSALNDSNEHYIYFRSEFTRNSQRQTYKHEKSEPRGINNGQQVIACVYFWVHDSLGFRANEPEFPISLQETRLGKCFPFHFGSSLGPYTYAQLFLSLITSFVVLRVWSYKKPFVICR